jgi:hypothetical protein
MASFDGNGFGCACGREQCDDNCPTYRNYRQMPSYPRMNGGQCTDASCPYKTSFGYCYYSACINPKYCTSSYTVEQRPTTNYGRIISKTPEALAEFIVGITDCGECEAFHGFRMCDAAPEKTCEQCWCGWLTQEAKDETQN